MKTVLHAGMTAPLECPEKSSGCPCGALIEMVVGSAARHNVQAELKAQGGLERNEGLRGKGQIPQLERKTAVHEK